MGLELKSKELDIKEPIRVEKIHDKLVKDFGTGGHVICSQKDVNRRAIVLILEEKGDSN